MKNYIQRFVGGLPVNHNITQYPRKNCWSLSCSDINYFQSVARTLTRKPFSYFNPVVGLIGKGDCHETRDDLEIDELEQDFSLDIEK